MPKTDPGRAASRNTGDAGGKAGTEAGPAEAGSHHAHRSDHNDGAAGKTGKRVLHGQAAGDGKDRDGRHGDSRQAPYAGYVTGAGQHEDDQADD